MGVVEYTSAVVIAVVALAIAELRWFRTGLFRRPAYWVTMAAMFTVETALDAWLTKLSAPIVLYGSDEILGIRIPFDIPVENYGFTFVLVTLTILLWEGQGGPHRPGRPST